MARFSFPKVLFFFCCVPPLNSGPWEFPCYSPPLPWPSPVMLNFEPHDLRNSFSLDNGCRKNGCGHPQQLVWFPEIGIPRPKECGGSGIAKLDAPPPPRQKRPGKTHLSWIDWLVFCPEEH
uniref:Secreted protein n=1 Tax=Micrurus spixii TaxID=129469 RepID=A0A2D4NL52_9SAUR